MALGLALAFIGTAAMITDKLSANPDETK